MMFFLDKLKALRERRKAKWESYCKKCGLCCYPRTRNFSGQLIIDLSDPCEHLDVQKKRCTIYHNRFRKCSHCAKVRLYHALFSPYMPPDCGYVEHYRFWKREKEEWKPKN
jgi:hypothetical protein